MSVLAVESVSKRFAELQAVDAISFEVRPGEIFGFLGPNGAGKTTTLRMIMGITRPDSGRVLFHGAETLDRSRIGYLPEERGLYEDSKLLDVLVYLGCLRGMSRAGARRAATDWVARMDLGDRMKGKVNALSKGNQQKIQFAGAVLHEPELAVLDEPFAGLDPLNQELFLDLIRALKDRGTAVLLSAHQLDLVERLCDRFLLISGGRRLLSGTLGELRRAEMGGAGEVLAVEVQLQDGSFPPSMHWQPGRGPAIELTWKAAEGGRARAEVPLPEDANLSPLLASLAEHYDVRRVETHTLSLHEIYVHAVQRDRAKGLHAPAEPEVAGV